MLALAWVCGATGGQASKDGERLFFGVAGGVFEDLSKQRRNRPAGSGAIVQGDGGGRCRVIELEKGFTGTVEVAGAGHSPAAGAVGQAGGPAQQGTNAGKLAGSQSRTECGGKVEHEGCSVLVGKGGMGEHGRDVEDGTELDGTVEWRFSGSDGEIGESVEPKLSDSVAQETAPAG